MDCIYLILLLCVCANAVMQNTSCPMVSPRELDWKELDGKWYIAAVATDLDIGEADCAMLMFTHMDSPEMSISWITNKTVSFHNGSVSITVDPNSNSSVIGDLLKITDTDQNTETYSFLDVDYQHYAVLFSCHDNEDGNSSTYEIWKLIRSPHLKESDAVKLDDAIANYSLQDTPFFNINNTEDTCSSDAKHLEPSLVMPVMLTSVAAYSFFNRLY